MAMQHHAGIANMRKSFCFVRDIEILLNEKADANHCVLSLKRRQ